MMETIKPFSSPALIAVLALNLPACTPHKARGFLRAAARWNGRLNSKNFPLSLVDTNLYGAEKGKNKSAPPSQG